MPDRLQSSEESSRKGATLICMPRGCSVRGSAWVHSPANRPDHKRLLLIHDVLPYADGVGKRMPWALLSKRLNYGTTLICPS